MLQTRKINADFCVVGGGMAGICAAIAAAREGAKTVLMHERPVLGGNASSEIRMWVCGAKGENNRETGIIEEIALENLYRNPTKNYFIWDTVLLDFVKREPNITLLLNCTCMDAEMELGEFADGRDRRIRSVRGYQMTTQTMIEVSAANFADCSGDSILAPLSGAEFRIGREAASEFGEASQVKEADFLTMGNSCLLQGRETTRSVPFTPPSWSTKLKKEHFAHRKLDLFKSGENFWYLELGGDRDTIADAEEISEELLPLAIGTWDYIKNSGDIAAENWELDFLGFLPGKRESRRMMGEYLITERDISADRSYEDTVAYGGWPLDDHYPAGFYHRGAPNSIGHTPAPYCLPYRALYSSNVENLFFAGRNISMTHTAMSSVRVMATCGLLGQAVGTAAALAARYGLTPHGIYQKKMKELQEILMDRDCLLPDRKRRISPDCSRLAPAALCNGEDRPHQKLYGSDHCGILLENGKSLEYRFERAMELNSCHIVFDSDLNRVTLPGDDVERRLSTRCNTRLDSPQFHLPLTLCRAFSLEIEDGEGVVDRYEIDENRSRYHHISFDKPIKALRLTLHSNWGNTPQTPLFSFDFK